MAWTNNLFFFQQIIVLWIAIGLQKTISIIIRYPGILIVSIFSCWTVGPVKTSNSSCQDIFTRTESIGISPIHTWVNLAITVALSICYGISYYPTSRFDWDQWIFMSLGNIISTVLCILIPTFLCILHGQYLTNYQGFLCCSNFWKSCCCKDFHNTEYTILNTSTMEEDIAKQELINLPINFEEVGAGCLTKLSCCYLYFFIVLLLLGLLAGICSLFFFLAFSTVGILFFRLVVT